MPESIEALFRLLGPLAAAILVSAWWLTQEIRARRSNGKDNPSAELHAIEDLREAIQHLDGAVARNTESLVALSLNVQGGVKRVEDIWKRINEPPVAR